MGVKALSIDVSEKPALVYATTSDSLCWNAASMASDAGIETALAAVMPTSRAILLIILAESALRNDCRCVLQSARR